MVKKIIVLLFYLRIFIWFYIVFYNEVDSITYIKIIINECFFQCYFGVTEKKLKIFQIIFYILSYYFLIKLII